MLHLNYIWHKTYNKIDIINIYGYKLLISDFEIVTNICNNKLD